MPALHRLRLSVYHPIGAMIHIYDLANSLPNSLPKRKEKKKERSPRDAFARTQRTVFLESSSLPFALFCIFLIPLSSWYPHTYIPVHLPTPLHANSTQRSFIYNPDQLYLVVGYVFHPLTLYILRRTGMYAYIMSCTLYYI